MWSCPSSGEAGRQSLLLTDQICLWLDVDKEAWKSWLKGVSLRCHLERNDRYQNPGRIISKHSRKPQREAAVVLEEAIGSHLWSFSASTEAQRGWRGWYFSWQWKKWLASVAALTPTSHLVSCTCWLHWHSLSEGPRRAGPELMKKDESPERKGRRCHQNKVSPSVTETERARFSTVDWNPYCSCSEAAAACKRPHSSGGKAKR